jgi:hypothetical protein
VHQKWLAEFHRMLKPGGLLTVTTRSREFIQEMDELRKNGTRPAEDALMIEHYQVLANLFHNTGQWLADYDRGDYCFDTCSGYGTIAGMPGYGETCISKGYIQKHWPRCFTLVGYIDDRSQCEQNVIVALNR